MGSASIEMDCGLDTNVLLIHLQNENSQAEQVNSALEILHRKGRRLCVLSQNPGEFWNVCTRPATVNGLVLGIEDAEVRLAKIDRLFYRRPDLEAIHMTWRELIIHCRVPAARSMTRVLPQR